MPDGTPPAIVNLTGDDDDGTYRDPTAAELAGVDDAPTTPLGELEAELLAPLDADPIKVNVNGRDGWVVCYRRDFTGKDVRKWHKQARVNPGRRGGAGDDEVDEVKFGGLIVSLTIVGMEKNGQPVNDPETGDPLTFSSSYLQRVYGAGSAIDTARRFFGGDGYLTSQANTVLEEAGWGGYADVADPS